MSEDGGPAFPSHIEHDVSGSPCGQWCHLQGMSLRDWFAGMALAGIKLRANDDVVEGASLDEAARQVALGAFAVADALLRQRQEAR